MKTGIFYETPLQETAGIQIKIIRQVLT